MAARLVPCTLGLWLAMPLPVSYMQLLSPCWEPPGSWLELLTMNSLRYPFQLEQACVPWSSWCLLKSRWLCICFSLLPSVRPELCGGRRVKREGGERENA